MKPVYYFNDLRDAVGYIKSKGLLDSDKPFYIRYTEYPDLVISRQSKCRYIAFYWRYYVPSLRYPRYLRIGKINEMSLAAAKKVFLKMSGIPEKAPQENLPKPAPQPHTPSESAETPRPATETLNDTDSAFVRLIAAYVRQVASEVIREELAKLPPLPAKDQVEGFVRQVVSDQIRAELG